MFDYEAYGKSKSKKSKLVFKNEEEEIFQFTKKDLSKIALIYVNEKEKIAKYINAIEFALIIEAFTKGKSYSHNDIMNGYKAPTGSIQQG